MAKVEAGMEAMVDMYIFESTTLLEQLDEILLRTEQANEFVEEDINEIFRIMHTVKGSSAMMGFENLSKLAHKGEDMFFLIREDTSRIQDAGFIYDLVFQMSDLFKEEIDQIQNNEDYEPTDFSEIISKLENGASILKGEAPSPNSETNNVAQNVSESKNVDSKIAGKWGDDCMSVRIFFEDGCKMENLRAFLLLNRIKEEAEIKEFIPNDVETNPDSANIIIDDGFVVTFKSEDNQTILKLIEGSVNVQSYEEITNSESTPASSLTKTVVLPGEKDNTTENSKKAPEEDTSKDNAKTSLSSSNVSTATASAASAANAAINNATGGSGKQSLISVNLLKLDQLHDIVGEIITTESMVISNPELDGLQLESFSKAARELRKLTDELQDTVMSIRMVPLTGPFQKMNRIVRDMKMKLGKDVDLKIEGDTTEVDKSIVDNLNDPLMHLVRNCMDHGIETSAKERTDKGKPAKGTITLTAANVSGEVIITVGDDGGGINCDKVFEKAERSGLTMKPRNEYTDREIQNMILLPGFSTNEEVTEFSGRGVGMDVVKKNIEKCGGSLVVESKYGEGTTFVIKIPLTLAIIDGMEIKVGDTIFTVPISAIRESFKVTTNQIVEDTCGDEMIMIRGECYPVLRLHNQFELEPEFTTFEEGIVLLVETESRQVCLFADRLIGEQQVVVKPFPSYLSQYNIKAQGLSGCTIMGDGSISLIVDIPNLVETI